jgi:hypothetical protein
LIDYHVTGKITTHLECLRNSLTELENFPWTTLAPFWIERIILLQLLNTSATCATIHDVTCNTYLPVPDEYLPVVLVSNGNKVLLVGGEELGWRERERERELQPQN